MGMAVCLALLSIPQACALSPPVPGQAAPDFAPVSAVPLNRIEAAVIENDQLRIIAKRGDVLLLKNQFILQNPARLVLDIANAKLGNAGLPFEARMIGDVPVNTIRLGQFTEDTVRIVVETPEPERLHVAVGNTGGTNALTLSAGKGKHVISSLVHFIFGRDEATPSVPSAPKAPIATGPNLKKPVPAKMPSAMATSLPPAADYPGLENLRRLRMAQPGFQANYSRRYQIVETARAQLGLSKDADRDYINRTFSQGRDTEWCADFVSTILEWTGGSPWGHLSRVQDIYEWGVAQGHVTSVPETANLVVFSNSGGSFDHVAFVESVNPDNTMTTIGGNEGYAAAAYKTSGSVTRSTYRLDDKRILGFVDPVAASGVSGDADPTSISKSRF